MSYVEDLMMEARMLFGKAKSVDDLDAKETYLINAYHIAMNAREHGEYYADSLMRDIKSYAERNGIYFN